MVSAELAELTMERRKMPKAKRVMIDDKLYIIGKTYYRKNLGWGYWVSGEEGENCMCIPAYPPGTTVQHGKHRMIFDE
jgi:hypothetical protein